MKNYKYLIPVCLVLGTAAGWYSMASGASTNQKEYKEYLTQADAYAEKEIAVDALENYQKALEIKDTVSVRMKIVEVYLENGEQDEAEEYAETVMKAYPGDSQIYERMMTYYIESKMYPEAFLLYDKAKAAGAVSATLKKQRTSILYEYMIQMDGYIEVSAFVNGICAVEADGKKGYIKESGDKLLFEGYEEITDFMDEFACVKVINEKTGSAEWELIDTEGNKRRAFPEELDSSTVKSVGNYAGGVYPVEVAEDQFTYYDTKGKVWKDGFVFAGPLYDGYLAVSDGSGCHFLNTKGESVGGSFESVALDEIGVGMRQERFFGKKNSVYQLYSVKGETLGSGSWEDAYPFLDNGSLAAVKQDGKWGFVDTKGNVVIQPQYEDARSFANGYAAVKQDGKWGFINEKNKMCIAPVFEETKDMNRQGNVFIRQNGVWSLLSLYSYNYKS